MPTLTIDLPDAAYRAAVALPESYLSRLVARAIEWDDEAEDEDAEDPTLPDFDRPTNAADLEAIYALLDVQKTGKPDTMMVLSMRHSASHLPGAVNSTD